MNGKQRRELKAEPKKGRVGLCDQEVLESATGGGSAVCGVFGVW